MNSPDADRPKLVQVQVVARTCRGDDDLRQMALMARKDAFVGVSLEGRDDIMLVRVTQPLQKIGNAVHCRTRKKDFLPSDDMLEGKLLVGLTNTLSLSLSRAKDVIFAGNQVCTATVEHEVTRRNAWGQRHIVTFSNELVTMATKMY